MTDCNHLILNKWAFIRALLSYKELRLLNEALIAYQFTLEAMTKTGKYDDFASETAADIKALSKLFNGSETDLHGTNKG